MERKERRNAKVSLYSSGKTVVSEIEKEILIIGERQ